MEHPSSKSELPLKITHSFQPYDRSNASKAKEDPWKDIASKAKSTTDQANPTIQMMVHRMNESYPFASAKGILDNGCGWGGIVSHILDAHGDQIPQAATLLAGDTSEAMLQSLREKRDTKIANVTSATTKNSWSRLTIQNLDAQDLASISENSLSHVTAGHLYFLLPKPILALRETYRVLTPNGITALTTSQSAQHVTALQDAFERVKPGTNLQMLKEPWSSVDGLKRELEAVGFVDVEVVTIETEMKYDTGNIEGFVDMLLGMPVLSDTLAGFDEEERGRLNGVVVEELSRADPEGKGVLKAVGILTLGRKSGK